MEQREVQLVLPLYREIYGYRELIGAQADSGPGFPGLEAHGSLVCTLLHDVFIDAYCPHSGTAIGHCLFNLHNLDLLPKLPHSLSSATTSPLRFCLGFL